MKRVPIIDFIRLASILAVIGVHFFPRWVATGYPRWVQKLILESFLNGTYGVTCFFTVSGFLITQMLVDRQTDLSKINLKVFYVKRAARIFPLLAAVILAGCSLEHLKDYLDPRIGQYKAWNIEGGFGPGFWGYLLTFNFNWYVVLKGSAAIGTQWIVLWSLAVEEQFYFFYPLVVKLLRKRGRVIMFLGAVILSSLLFRAWCFLYTAENPDWMQKSSFAAFDQIAMGGLLYFIWERWKGSRADKFWINFFLLASGFSVCLFLYLQTSIDNPKEGMVVPTLMAAGCALMILGGLNLRFLNSSLAGFVSGPGKLSYGCYLWFPTLIFLFLPLWARLQGLTALTALNLLVWVTAWVSYRLFELPVNNRIRLIFGLKPSQTL